jgi:hypothetical protein
MTRKQRFTILLGLVLLCQVACSRPAKESATPDSTLKDSVKVRLFDDPRFKSETVEISSSNGEVTLDGDVSSEQVHQQMVDFVQSTPGVTKVHDALNVKSASVADTVGANPAGTPAPANSPAAAAKAPADAGNSPTPTVTNTPPPPQPKKIVIKEGTEIQVRTIDTIDSDKAKIGGSFMATVDAPVVVGDNVIVPKNSKASLVLLDASNSGNFKGKSEIHVALESIEVQGKRYVIQSSTYSEEGKSQGKQTAKKVGIGTAIGAGIGAIAGGGKGAAIGAGVGAAGGAVTQVLTKGKQVNVPSETKLGFTLEKPLEITIQPSAKASAK